MAINTQKVLVGGIAAGVALFVMDFIVNALIFGERMRTEMNAFMPGLADRMEGGGAMATYVVTDLVIGLVLVWMYAAIRPRFGPGMKTASYPAIAVWILGALFFMPWMTLGMMSTASYVMYTIIWLPVLLVASWVGGWLYKEEGTAAVAA